MLVKVLSGLLLTSGMVLAAAGVASAVENGPYTDHDGMSGLNWCKLDRQSHPGAGDCYENPPGSGQWYFGAPTVNSNG